MPFLAAFCIPLLPHDYFSLFIPTSPPLLLRMRLLFQTVAHSSHSLFLELRPIPLLTTGYKVSSLSASILLSLIIPTNSLVTLFSSLPFFLLFRLTLRCHLDPPSTLASPEPFSLSGRSVLLPVPYSSSSIMAPALLVDEFSW